MWHPFQIMPGEIAVSEPLKTAAKPSAHCRLTYGERVIRWFLRETDQEGHLLPNVDERTGLVIEKRTVDHFLELQVRHQKDLGVPHILEGTMQARRNDWRSPLSWDFEQKFIGARGIRNFRETGHWNSGQARLVSGRGQQEIVRTEAVDSLTCLYTLLADFPTHVEPYPRSYETSVLEDLSIINRGALLHAPPPRVREHPMARGLRGYVVDYPANFPIEFWVNEHGAVIYVCFGPNRALFLQSIEELS
jgi:hypothetical protein